MKATIFGAGNIGRGLIGAVLAPAGYDLTFVDANPQIVTSLSERGSYDLITGATRTTIEISGIINASDENAVIESVSEADIVATAVGPPILKIVAGPIAAGIETVPERTLNVLACENVHPNSSALRAHVTAAEPDISLANAGFPDVVVDRIVPGDPGSIDVTAEITYEFVVDETNWSGPKPNIPGITFTSDLDAYKLRKLWLVNGLHSITAWMGLQADYELVDQAIADPIILKAVESAAATMVKGLLASTTEFTAADLEQYAATSIARFANADLGDVNVRVARNPMLKLAAGERILGPAAIAEERDFEVDGLAAGIAAAISLRDHRVAGIDEWATAIDSRGWEDVLVSSLGASAGGQLVQRVRDFVDKSLSREGTKMVTEEIVIANPSGLHARPAAQIVEEAKGLDAVIQIKKDDKVARADSIMSVLALGANTGDTVTIVAEGDDAATAVATLRAIMTESEH